jgi:ribosomal-protein-alanine N-acetyltransferase
MASWIKAIAIAGPPPSIQLNTTRLLLRPTGAGDADRAFEIQSEWGVTRMLAMAGFPPDQVEMRYRFAGHSREWLAGSAYRFAVAREVRLIGVVVIAAVDRGEGALATGSIEPSGAWDTPQRPPGRL